MSQQASNTNLSVDNTADNTANKKGFVKSLFAKKGGQIAMATALAFTPLAEAGNAYYAGPNEFKYKTSKPISIKDIFGKTHNVKFDCTLLLKLKGQNVAKGVSLKFYDPLNLDGKGINWKQFNELTKDMVRPDGSISQSDKRFLRNFEKSTFEHIDTSHVPDSKNQARPAARDCLVKNELKYQPS